jgi:glycosyltransferase involved in cell wall biosynthesis
MKIVVDGVIYKNYPIGGVARVFNELLVELCNQEPLLEIALLSLPSTSQYLPSHPHIQIPKCSNLQWWNSEYNSRFENALYRSSDLLWPILVGDTRKMIWHSTYFTDSKHWRGRRVVTVHDMIYELFPQIFASDADKSFRQAKRRCIDMADAIICVSKTTQDDLLNYYGGHLKNRVWVVPNGYGNNFSQNIFSPPFEIRLPRKFILYIGSRNAHKNFKWFLETYAVWERRRDFPLLVVGGGWSSDEHGLVDQLELGENLHLIEHVDDHQLCYLYNQAAAFVHPSLYEGFGIPILEAMACGCPIVASHIPTTIEIAQKYPFYFEKQDKDGLIQALDLAISENKLSDRICQGIALAKNYSWQEAARKTLEVYREIT